MPSNGKRSLSTGILVVVVSGIAFVWLPMISLVDLEVFGGGLLAGYLMGSSERGATAGGVGGLIVGSIWALWGIVLGDASGLVVLVLLLAANGAVGGALGGWLSDA